jgi:2-C-methyl-D-erythritol 2,4-cyclodiphosphate synthase
MALLTEVAKKVAHDGWWVENVDVTIAAETPKLAPHVEAMATNVVATLSLLREPMGHGIAVSVRPKRGEGLGAIGRAEGIAVWAVVLLSRG